MILAHTLTMSDVRAARPTEEAMMNEEEIVRIDRELWDAWNARGPERYVKLLDEKWVAESDTVPAPVRGRDGAREFMKMYVPAFPDLHFHVDHTLANGEFVVSRYTETGTHRGILDERRASL